MSVLLDGPGKVAVDGFGIPFTNKQNPELDDVVNHNKPIVEDVTLLDVIRADKIYLVVPLPYIDLGREFSEASLPRPFSYPYGTEHSWNLERYRDILREHKDKYCWDCRRQGPEQGPRQMKGQG